MTLHPVRQRAIVIGFLTAFAIGLLLMMAMLIVGMWIDLTIPLSVGIRRLILVATALCAVVSVIVFVRRASSNYPVQHYHYYSYNYYSRPETCSKLWAVENTTCWHYEILQRRTRRSDWYDQHEVVRMDDQSAAIDSSGH